ncbi:LacI family DNA-binding transcriptional regulator [Kribbella sp. NPDC051718]|uniref:LacI family DNA-binding transcriptional regulator n=1 Tax=Kribbella sp. NPDC051718 TaxID=3155168 RepID=UPI00343D07C2
MATVRDVAERAGVSIATVSFVLNNTKPVTPATRDRVESAMAELGYHRNVLARALAARSTRIIALAHPRLDTGFGSEFITSASRAARARARGYHLVLWPVDNDGDEIGELVGQGLVDGVVLMEVLLEDARVDALSAAGTPFALIGRTADPAGFIHVDIDFEQSIAVALDHLQGLGHRPTVAAGRALRLPSRITAVIMMNELATFGVMTERVVPDDLSILYFGTPGLAAIANPQLTLMRAPAAILGGLGVDALIDHLETPGALPAPQLHPCTLEPGASTARPR